MKDCYEESVIYEIAQELERLIDKKVITEQKKIVLYGLDTFSFAMRTVLDNLGFKVDSYISDDPLQILSYQRQLKSIRARYLNSSRDLIGIYLIEERLKPFDKDIVVINASRSCPIHRIEELNYCENINFFMSYDWKRTEFTQAMQGKKAMVLREIQDTAKSTLYMVDRFCEKHEIRYWVCGGTLLGTIRHKGFIPWDDDIDIFMPWKDYLRFTEEFTDTKYYYLASPEKVDRCDYHELFSKMMDKRTMAREDSGFLWKVHPVSIDIFPLIGLPEQEDERRLFFSRYYELEKTIWEDFYKKNGNLNVYNTWYAAQKEFLEKYDFDTSEYVGVLATAYKERDCAPRNVYVSTLRMPFEDIKVNVPSGYKEYLDRLYGPDWMELPKEEDRISNHKIEAYRL